ncbi:hypothetical protein [Bacillus sp. FJAT-25509]|uniref:hypothetical protein n=1 Tax=Bacillus sp. FJAT-25509 TaxID=1712029 RepID=UPI000701FB7D|nr:hypothetical protein [Bacillus sp. FJAT-25509]
MSNVKLNYENVYKGYKIKETDKENFVLLKKGPEVGIRITKLISITVLIITILVFSLLNKSEFAINNINNTNISIIMVLILISIIVHFSLTFLLHIIAYKKVFNIYFKESNEGKFIKLQKAIWKKIKTLVGWILTPDLMMAKYYKKKIMQTLKKKKECICGIQMYQYEELCVQCHDSIRIMNKFFIKFSNWLNVTLTCVLGTLIVGMLLFKNSVVTFFIYILFFTLLYRLLSRTIEIGTAFYKDVVQVKARIFGKVGNKKIYLHGWKDSFIRKPLRISLAVHSLFELLISFFLLYILTYFLFNEIIIDPLTKSKITDYISGESILDFIFYTISITFFNISYTNYNLWLWNLLHVWQVTLSTILIVLSIASYLSYDDDVSERDADFFEDVLPKIGNNS